MGSILLIDDNEAYCEQIKKTLALRKIDLDYESDAQKALERAVHEPWEVILLDIVLNQDLHGLELLQMIKKAKPTVPVIMVSGVATMDSALEALEKGAFDYLEKPIEVERMITTIKHAQEYKHLRELSESLINEMYQSLATESLGKTLKKALDVLTSMDEMAERLLLIGEAGTGKELVAKMIHFNSKRKFWPFLTYHCNNAEENEDELFGRESSPENPVTKHSLFCKAHKGTLYLGEIGALSLEGQKKLVRFIHENYYLPPKGILKEPLNIRLIFSSSVELKPLVEKGSFLQELYDLLNTLTVHLPPLRERKDEIPRLARYFLKQFSRELNRKVPRLTREAKDRLCGHEWPGNISELKRIIQLLVNLFDRPVIDKAMIEGAFLYDRIQKKIQEKRPVNEILEAIKKFYEVVNPAESKIPVL